MRATGWLTMAVASAFLAGTLARISPARADSDGIVGESSPIAVQAHLKVGDVWRYQLSFDLLVSKGDESASVAGRIVQSANLTLKADRATSDGSFVIKGTFNRLTSIWRRGNEQHEFSWVRDDTNKRDELQKQPQTKPKEQPADPVNNPLAGRAPALDDAGVYQSVFETLAKSEFTILVSADGRVSRVGGFGSALGMLSIAKTLDETAMGVFLPPRFAEAIEPIWRADRAGVVKKIGDTWEQSRRVRFGRASGIAVKTAWRAESLERDTLESLGAISVNAISPEHPSPTQPTFEVVRGQGEGSFTWSQSDNELIEREEKLDLVLVWTLEDLKTELHQYSTKRLERTP